MREDSKDLQEALDVYPEIIDGFSEIPIDLSRFSKADVIRFEIGINFSRFYFKHPTHSDSVRIKKYYRECLEEAKESGILSEQLLIASAIEKKWWSEDKERELLIKTDYVKRMTETRSKAMLSSQKKQLDELIETEELAIKELEQERSSFVVDSAETFAAKKIDEFYISSLCYLDKSLSTRLFDDDELEFLSDPEFQLLSFSLFNKINKISHKKIHYLSASSFFQEIIRACPDDSAYEFYGIPSSKLTIHQTDLFVFGNYYKKAIKASPDRIPDEIISDPESLIKWFSSSNSSSKAKQKLQKNPNAKKTKGERSGRISSFVGATEEDYKNLGLKSGSSTGGKDLIDLAKDSGGTVDMGQLVKSI